MTRRFFTAKPLTQAAPGGSLDMGLRLSAFVAPAEPVEPAAPVICPECPECPECPPAGECVGIPAFGQASWDAYTYSAGGDPTWSGDCVISTGDYGNVSLSPLGGWNIDARPSVMIVDGPDLAALVGPDYYSILVTDPYGRTIGYLDTHGLTPPFVIGLNYQAAPYEYISGVYITAHQGDPISLCTIDFKCF